MWKTGAMKVRNSIFHFWVKCFDEPSHFGIEGGRISKLCLKKENTIVCNYDRGWDIEPKDEDTQTALQILMKEYN